jgi:glycosyltransferase involved in cell wall biosynthesis
MSENNGRISVAMTTFNGNKYVAEQLSTILRALQGYPDSEIVVSDDGSFDDTLKTVLEVGGGSARIIRNKGPRGIVANVESALRACTGDFIFLADQDDVWLPNRVSAVLPQLQTHDVVVCDCCVTDARGAQVAQSFYDLRRSRSGLTHNFLRNGYLGCCMAFRKEVLRYALPFPRNLPMHDIWIGLTSELFGSPFFCEESLVRYRRHGSNHSSTSQRSSNSAAAMLIIRLRLFLFLALRFIRVRLQIRSPIS